MQQKDIKVLFVLKSRVDTYGISLGLINSARFVARAIDKHIRNVDTKVETVVDGNFIDKEIHSYKPNHCIVEALWATPAKIEELARKHPAVQFSIRVHSKTPFIANEGIAFEWLTGYADLYRKYANVRLSANNLDFATDARQVLKVPVDYLPNIYMPDTFDEKRGRKKAKPASRYIDIGCFGAIRPLKNTLQQAVAAIIFADQIGKRLRFHINSGRLEQKGDAILKNLRALFAVQEHHVLIEHPWMPHSEFVKIVNFMDLGMQVSFSESFNIVTADQIAHDVPIVVSTDIDWAPYPYRAIPTDTYDIVKRLGYVWRFPKTANFLANRALNKYNKESIGVWKKYLNDNKS
jgi:hypothetical protein